LDSDNITPAHMRRVIDELSTFKHYLIARKLVRKFGMCESDFPLLAEVEEYHKAHFFISKCFFFGKNHPGFVPLH
jgi:hypothetical protein